MDGDEVKRSQGDCVELVRTLGFNLNEMGGSGRGKCVDAERRVHDFEQRSEVISYTL